MTDKLNLRRVEIIDSSGSDFQFDDEVYFTGRITVNQVTKHMRDSDGLLPGQTVSSHEVDSLPELSWLIGDEQRDLPKYIIHSINNDSLDSFLKNAEHFGFDDLEDAQIERMHINLFKFGELGAAVKLIESLPEQVQVERVLEPFYAQKMAVKALIVEFMERHSDAVLDPTLPGSVQGLAEFSAFYKARIQDQLNSKELFDMLQGNRGSLIAALGSPGITHKLGVKNSKRIAEHVNTQPLIITDPLSSIMHSNGTTEPYAWFNLGERRTYIDPIAIRRTTENQAEFEATCLKVMVHEFIHASTDNVYTVETEDDTIKGITSVNSKTIWPKFFNEAMTEKVAYLVAVAARPDLFKKLGDSHDWRELPSAVHYEKELRTSFSANPKEVLAPIHVREARDVIASSYAGYRLIVDTIMANADWKSAGVTKKQAENMLLKAFLNRGDDIRTQDTKDRKRFMQTLGKATYPGFLQKVGQLVDMYGTNLVLDVLESPKFDIKESSGLPILASPSVRNRIYNGAARLRTINERIEQLKSTDAPAILIEFEYSKLNELQQFAEVMPELNVATSALWGVLWAQYGCRPRSRELVRLPIDVLRLEMGMQIHHRTLNVEDLDSKKADVKKWQERALHTREQGGWFKKSE